MKQHTTDKEVKNKREKILLGGYEMWLDMSGYPAIWLYDSETAKNGIPVDVLYDGKLIGSSELNDTEKAELLNHLKTTKPENTTKESKGLHTPGDDWKISNNIGKDGQTYVPAYFVTGKRVHCEFGILPPGYGFPEDEIEQSKKEAKENAELILSAPTLKAENEKLRKILDDFISDAPSVWIDDKNMPDIIKELIEKTRLI